jgi:hypothetical protein
MADVDIANTRVHTVGTGFLMCCAATRVALPPTLRDVGDHFLSNMPALTALDLSGMAIERGCRRGFLSGCAALTTVRLPASLTSLGDHAMAHCTALTAIDLSGTALATVGDHFLDCCSALRTVALPLSVTGCGQYAHELVLTCLPASVRGDIPWHVRY